jgi:hypothetical protein
MIMVMWWRDIITYIMVAWLEECACSSTDKHIVISLEKIGFFALKEMDFYCKRMQLWFGPELKGTVLRGDWAHDHTQKRKQAQVARKPNKIWVKWATKECEPLILFYQSWKASTEDETPRKWLRARSYERMQRRRSSCYRLRAASDI